MMAAAQPVDLPNDQNLAPRAPRRLVRDDVIDLVTGADCNWSFGMDEV
jgi:hypothetical protein